MINSAISGVNKRLNSQGPRSTTPKPFPGFQPPGQPKSRALPTMPNLQGPPINNAEPIKSPPAQLPGPSLAQVPPVSPRVQQPVAQPARPPMPVRPATPTAPAGLPAQPASVPQPSVSPVARQEKIQLMGEMKTSLQNAMDSGNPAAVERINSRMNEFEGSGQPEPIPQAPQQAAEATNPALMAGIQQIQQAQSVGDMSQIRKIAGQMLQGGVNPQQLAGYFQQMGIGREVIDRFFKPQFG